MITSDFQVQAGKQLNLLRPRCLMELATPSNSASRPSLTLVDSAGSRQSVLAALEKAVLINQDFFLIGPSHIDVFVANNPAEWKRQAGAYAHLTFAWGVVLDDGKIVVKSPEYAGITDAQHESVLCHEINHSYWITHFGKLGVGWSPHWVVEGVANYVSPARSLLSPQSAAAFALLNGDTATALEYDYVDVEGAQQMILKYSLWRAVVADVIDHYGKDALLGCIRSFAVAPSRGRFDEAFLATFGVSLEPYFHDFLLRTVATIHSAQP
jgi:hypothetical protein